MVFKLHSIIRSVLFVICKIIVIKTNGRILNLPETPYQTYRVQRIFSTGSFKLNYGRNRELITGTSFVSVSVSNVTDILDPSFICHKFYIHQLLLLLPQKGVTSYDGLQFYLG